MSVARSLGVPTLQTYGFELDPKHLSYADFTQIFKIYGFYMDFSWIFADLTHSSLLSVFGLSATSTYDSYLPLIFGIFGMI